MQRKAVEQAARARAEKIQAVAAVQQRVQTAKEEADKAREVSHRSLFAGISRVDFVCCAAMSGLSICWTSAPPLVGAEISTITDHGIRSVGSPQIS